MTRKSLAGSIRSDPLQAWHPRQSAHGCSITITDDERSPRFYCPTSVSGRISPRVIQIPTMALAMEDVQHPLPPPDGASMAPDTMENHYFCYTRVEQLK